MPCKLGCDLAQDAAAFRRYVIAEGSVGSENIMLEGRSPASPHLRRHTAQGEHAMEQAVEDRTPRLAAFVGMAVAQWQAFVARFSRALAAERRNRAAIERELFHGQYRLTSKCDDDLPVCD